MTLAGIDDRIWTAVGTVDTAFDKENSRNSVEHYHEHWNENQDRPDPISKRMYPDTSSGAPTDASFLDPRKYYWTVLDIWTEEVEFEYGFILDRFKDALRTG